MKTYQSKLYRVQAEEITKLAYCQLRGWDVPVDEDPDLVGYLVHVFDRPANTKVYDHFVRWQDKADFDARHEEAKPDTYITRMETELSELQDRLGKLSAFLVQQTAKPTLSVEDLSDLFFQEKLMQELAALLSKRLVKAKSLTC